MANPRRKVPQNSDGEFFVDTTCIDCDACRQLAPATFAEGEAYSYVAHQPSTDEERRSAFRALLACPTGSIGTTGINESADVVGDFPLPIEGEVSYCGFNSPKSFGGNSYFIRHPAGNWLIDSPKFVRHLTRAFEEAGGIRFIFLTHRDDVADASRYAEHFGAERIIHRNELSAQPGAEIVVEGDADTEIAPEFRIIPTFGHTRGHCCLLYRRRFLFTGDHLWWSRNRKGLNASEDVCWYSWEEQVASVAKLQSHEFAWVLPGHGEKVHFPPDVMKTHLAALSSRIARI
jgi:glyoxylase-like metal-dependent hydrolase (beta-lactamase superfamily II)